MPVINIINFKYKGLIRAYSFFLSIFSKSLTTENILLFENLNII